MDPQQIIITTGAMEALSLSLQVLTEPGDWVVVESPTFYGALQAIERLKLKVVEIPVIPGSASISPCWRRPSPSAPSRRAG